MKVLHVSTYSNGGAGSAARRLHESLVASGVDSFFLTVDNSTAHLAKRTNSLFRRTISRIGRNLASTVSVFSGAKEDNLSIHDDYEIFTTPYSKYDLTLHPAYIEADIINLHWVSSFIDVPSFFKKNNKPVVWTLHDMNPFQGGFHYHEDVVRNQHLKDLEEQYKSVKLHAVTNSDLHVVALSRWMLEESKRSDILGRFPHVLIPNGIRHHSFKSYNKNFAREVFGLTQTKIIILFVCDFLNNRRKGFDLINESLLKFSDNKNILFCVVGRNKFEIDYDNLVYIDPVQDERLMGILYSASDVVVLPSREDNLPNVMLEAMACGIPVVSTPVGGMLDVIKAEFNGVFSKDVSSAALYNAIYQALELKEQFKSDDIISFVKNNYSSELQVKKYRELYSKILKIKVS